MRIEQSNFVQMSIMICIQLIDCWMDIKYCVYTCFWNKEQKTISQCSEWTGRNQPESAVFPKNKRVWSRIVVGFRSVVAQKFPSTARNSVFRFVNHHSAFFCTNLEIRVFFCLHKLARKVQYRGLEIKRSWNELWSRDKTLIKSLVSLV